MGLKGEIWVIIPARGGSKGLPRKNIVPLNGIPLIAYSIAVAKAASNISRVFVSTDDSEIAEVARRYGAEVPFLRPEELSGDRSEVGEAIDYTADRIARQEGVMPFGLCILYPTHPFRTPQLLNDITAALQDYIQVNTACRVRPDLKHLLTYRENGFVIPVMDNVYSTDLFYTLGTAYAFRYIPAESRFKSDPEKWRELLESTFRSGAIKSRYTHLHIITDPLLTVDIDDERDLKLAEEVIRSGFSFGGVSVDEYRDTPVNR